ncbi:hypothetical protein LOD99_12314 [Oopsacas minuta]|uniref:Uncharacterized protein n=1 Tax=Oopsacas minuta TaxID=111878 RepID=A0AAV7JEV3_9METZ|nr:hypothetical protein LOD99_12314 [Oopsacas minuta]
MSNYTTSTSSGADCSTVTTTYKDEQVLIIFLSSLVFGIFLFVIFFILRFILWEFGKQNVYKWGKNKQTEEYSENDSVIAEDLTTELEVAREHSCFNWVKNYVKFGLRGFRKRVGVDAYLYHLFLLHLVVLMCCYVFVCIVVVLTVNKVYCSKNLVSTSLITHTSISACIADCSGEQSSADIIWLHSTMAHLLVFIGLIIALNYRRILYRYEHKSRFQFNAIQVRNLPRPHSQAEADDIKKSLCKHFSETEDDGESPITIDFAYDVAKYHSLRTKYNDAEKNLLTYEGLDGQYGVKQYIYPRFGKLLGWGEPVLATDYFRAQSHELAKEMQIEKEKAIESPQSLAFIGFPEGFDAFSVSTKYILLCGRPRSSQSVYLKQNLWQVRRAPAPSDINWHNIRTSWFRIAIWYIRWCIINLFVLILLLFFTTPASVFSILDIILRSTGATGNTTHIDNNKESVNFIIDYVLTHIGLGNSTAFDAARSLALAYAAPLLQILVASIIPLMVAYASFLEFHWTKSDTMKAAILKTYSFLLLMLLIFPSFTLVSFNLVFDLIIKESTKNSSISQFTNLTLIAFSPDTGIFFLNYLNISSFFVLIQLFQIPSLLMYLYRKLSARNEAESLRSHESYTYYFKFGIEYAWVLVKITIAIVYGTLFPIITLSGLLYLIMKMAVDRYNLIYQARSPPEFSGRISVHLRALRFLHASLVLSQIYMLILSIILYGYSLTRSGLLAFNAAMLILTILVLLGVQGIRWFQKYIHDFRISLRTLFTHSHDIHLMRGQSSIFQQSGRHAHAFSYFDIINDATSDTDSQDARVV